MRPLRPNFAKGLKLIVALLLLAGCGTAPSTPGSAAADPVGGAGIPPGFKLSVFAEGLDRARFMAFGADGTLYVGSNSDRVWALPNPAQRDRADQVVVFARGLRTPHSVAWRDGWLYVGETHRVIRLRDTNGDFQADEQEVVVASLPAGQMHFTRTIGFGPDGGLYVSVGSSCNACKEADERRAALLRFNPDGSGGEVYARGLRNAVGFTWHPVSKDLWATDNGRDWLGDELPPEELDRVQRGDDHGWPYCYGRRVPDPEVGFPQRCASTVPATFEMPAHSAPLGLDFYTGKTFPEAYRGDLFIAFHGSWNRSVPTGYKVVRVRFRPESRPEASGVGTGAQPVALEDFVDVWFQGGRVRHRPVDVKTGPDGALYISDDRGGTIFRVTYSR